MLQPKRLEKILCYIKSLSKVPLLHQSIMPQPTKSALAQAQLLQARKARSTLTRRLLLASIAVYYMVKTFHAQFWPWERPMAWPTRGAFSAVNYANVGLQLSQGKVSRIFPRVEDNEEDNDDVDDDKGDQRLIKGTETVLVDKHGAIFGMTEEGHLLSFTDIQTAVDGITSTAKVTVVKDLGVGRPLGGEFSKDGHTLWIADAVLGLTKIQNPTNPHSKVELVASRVTLDDGTESQFLYTNDLVVGPVTGKIYFTDSSTVVPTRVQTRTWDTMYAAKYDIFRAKPTGRLLEYDPATDKVKVLATGMSFSNGIGVNGDESYLVISETSAMRIVKYHLKGPNAGQVQVLVADLPGYPDGLSCSPAGQCFSVMPSSIVPLHKLTAKLPDFMDIILRHLVLALPRQLAPVSVFIYYTVVIMFASQHHVHTCQRGVCLIVVVETHVHTHSLTQLANLDFVHTRTLDSVSSRLVDSCR